jgi:hypothetical protein
MALTCDAKLVQTNRCLPVPPFSVTSGFFYNVRHDSEYGSSSSMHQRINSHPFAGYLSEFS